tara:strand:- start:812 stop:2833 length:2022 start_codon:yes stop_codon:yes gene_type:complete
MAYNLLGQQGPKGQRNPDPNLSDAEATYLYNTPPGRGDNKGLVKTSFGTLGPADKKTHNKKLEEAGIEIEEKYDFSSTSFGEKPKVEAKEVLPPATTKEINNVNSITDLAELAFKKRLSPTQKNLLIGTFGFEKEVVDNVVLAGETAGNVDYISQLKEEDAFIRNIVNNHKAIREAEEEKRDTRSLVQKETDFIKDYVEKKNEGIDPGSVNYIEQMNEEMDHINNFVKTLKNQSDAGNNTDDIANNNAGGGTPPPSEGPPPPDQEPSPLGGEGSPTGSGEQQEGNAGDIYDFLNIPEGAYLWDVDGTNYIVYEVPGSDGELYEGNPIFMAYEVQENDIVKAGIYSPEAPSLTGAPVSKVFFDKIAIVTGNTDQLSADIDNPFASFVETISEQALVAPWIKDPEMISLIAEAAVEGRTVTDAEWQVTNWYQENNETKREWLRTYYSDPSTAAQLTTDAQLAVANSLQASGVSNAPEALINWVAGRYVSGEWSDAYTTEQIALFADPYAQGKRDAQFENYLSSTAISGVDRTTAREREVEELFATWLGPTLGKLTDQEKAEMAGRLRDDPDYKDTLIGSLKQSRLAAFSNYTNPELTYDDIARPWRNLTTSVWGQTADETQGWWQEMVKSNDFATAQTTLREKGLENNITQVTQDATQALTQALGEGLATQGVNQ